MLLFRANGSVVVFSEISKWCELAPKGIPQMGRKYANPPLIEAVCEFRLTPDSKWDPTIPGLMYEKVRGEFPNKEQRLIQEVELTQDSQGMRQQLRTSERAWFLSDDRKTFVQIGTRLLAINRLKPYISWAEFRPKIEKAFETLLDTADDAKGLQRIGLRYINRIEIPGASVDLDDYFEFRPFLGSNLPRSMASFIVGCLLPFFDGRDSCRVQLTNAVPEDYGNSAFLLDLDYFLDRPQAVPENEVLEWVETAHERVEELFEGCIKDSLREIFQEVE